MDKATAETIVEVLQSCEGHLRDLHATLGRVLDVIHEEGEAPSPEALSTEALLAEIARRTGATTGTSTLVAATHDRESQARLDAGSFGPGGPIEPIPENPAIHDRGTRAFISDRYIE